MFLVNEVITGKEVSIVFNDGNVTAGLPKDTKRMLLAESRSGRLLEYLHFDPLDVLALPLVEDGAEKIAPSFSRHGTVADTTLLVRLPLDQGQKTYVLNVDLLEEPVDLGGMSDVL
jgi:hypothetical protein